VCENKVLRRKFGPKREEATIKGEWRKNYFKCEYELWNVSFKLSP
jgi:hypothetical protein